ncbi:6-phosphogluconate dehydrogenase C-terminal domain-like protein [Gloeophyllum trabeum ATCC 11539]|uniref:6-phosphogluconate dehydrogenase C-terminal domain-like protein n=1 Tax=Gloeophyllum trabeum (strain ATCC 11539 / FP-39264 / Madison 617) TaxID=670483 RepID=S7Q5D2_GLOTA|nr:6-phosphogluconate dehydrogenase C-terminal domain-like protein [Gloeophyllum trabeum ATCC 11539]EPQ54703.1 6-phosphogluconate dehydrogenase C-terminal domain-like protein [Gloeophyllum trabeum ATCC 11539]
MPAPRVAVVAPGAMGAAVAKRLTSAGCTVLTTLEGRSPASRRRAEDAGMHDAPLPRIAAESDWVLSILPPSDAYSFAEKFVDAYQGKRSVGFADCNAVNPGTVKKIRDLFKGTDVRFVDAGIIGGPPKEGYDPTFYASADSEDVLKSFVALGQYGLKITPLEGADSSVGDASALKMSYAGLSKGIIGLTATMILAAHASSPTTARALLNEMHISQPALLARSTTSLPNMLPKAYRWVGEMEEIAEFVGGPQGDIYKGLARTFERVEASLKEKDGGGEDVQVLKEWVESAKKELEGDTSKEGQ